jgi:hypothetical protein
LKTGGLSTCLLSLCAGAGAAARRGAAIPAADAVVGKQGDRRDKRDDWHLHAIILAANVSADHCALLTPLIRDIREREDRVSPYGGATTTRRTNRR